MSDKPPTFGTTLSNGIQDVAALLPLLGTEQCERHVGSALEKGYLYAAATSLSLFGSLGIVKATFATLLATITYPFYGGRWLDDAGFSTLGSVLSMVMIDKETGWYGAEVKLQKLLQEQHIDDPSLVKGFDWSEWNPVVEGEQAHKDSWSEVSSKSPAASAAVDGEDPKDDLEMNRIDVYSGQVSGQSAVGDKQGNPENIEPGVISRVSDSVKHYLRKCSWNSVLILLSLLSAILSITPYLYLMKGHWGRPLSWLFPLLRSFGSFLLVWLTLQRKHRFKDDIGIGTQRPVLEDRIRRRFRLPMKSIPYLKPREHASDEKQSHVKLSQEERERLITLLAMDWYLVLYQVIMVIGMGMIVAGYVGCFSLVGQTQVESAPYVWFGLETALSLFRIFLWGLNPDWDERTGLRLSLELYPHLHDPNSDHKTPFPLITSPYDSYELHIKPDYDGNYTSSP
ncbi:hypothetical protein Moror_2561 [Moniliophthora roreri MCA 2997]|uniref:Uncharacterized protein n=1 Tax=Moniliophthora roreri (strain MCA 2997) TaxID=1381753 RepID=V2XFF3_MONRO|nr:hypothetical protein Moror_2561 [Moniliophthora roreri MCA 2997]